MGDEWLQQFQEEKEEQEVSLITDLVRHTTAGLIAPSRPADSRSLDQAYIDNEAAKDRERAAVQWGLIAGLGVVLAYSYQRTKKRRR